MKFVYRLKIELALRHGARCSAAELMRPSRIGMIVVFEIGSRFVEREKLVFWNAQPRRAKFTCIIQSLCPTSRLALSLTMKHNMRHIVLDSALPSAWG